MLQTIYEEGMYGMLIFLHFYIFCSIRQEKLRRKNRRSALFLLFAEGHAVGALILSGAGLMSTYQDPVQRAVVCGLAVVGALLDGALDALVCVVVHGVSSFFRNGDSMTRSETVMRMRANQYFFICCIHLRLTSHSNIDIIYAEIFGFQTSKSKGGQPVF